MQSALTQVQDVPFFTLKVSQVDIAATCLHGSRYGYLAHHGYEQGGLDEGDPESANTSGDCGSDKGAEQSTFKVSKGREQRLQISANIGRTTGMNHIASFMFIPTPRRKMMKNFKKILALMLSAAMVFALATCGSGSSDSGNETASAEAETEADAVSLPAGVNDGTGDVLRVAMECAYAPYNWTQEDDSNGAVPIQDSTNYAYGYDVMMAQYIADALGMELEIYQLDWDSLPLAVKAGTVDCVIAGQSITSERLETVDFSDPYYYASIVVLVKSDSEYATAEGVSDLAGCVATSQVNTVWYDTCIPQIENVTRTASTETTAQMLVQLEAGAIDVVVTDQPTALGACAAYDDFTMLDFTDSDDNFEVSEEEINIGISMYKGNTGLCDAINSVLATLTTDDFTEMMNEAIAVQPLTN